MLKKKQLKKMLTELGYSGSILDKNFEALLSIANGGGSGGGTTYTYKFPLSVNDRNEVSINLAGYVTTTTLNSALKNYTATNLLGNEFRNAVENNASLQNAIKDVALPSILAGTGVTVNYNNTSRILTISATGGSGGSGGGSIPSADAFVFRERITGVNWTINSGSNAFFNFTGEFATQGVVDQDSNFLTGNNPFFIYDSATQSLKMRQDIVNEHIEFLISCRASYNGGSGSEFAFALCRPSVGSNVSSGIIETSIRTQGQNVQSTQTRKNGLNINTRLLSTPAGADPFQTEGFKLGFFNYSTSTDITITDVTLTIVMLNRIKF